MRQEHVDAANDLFCGKAKQSEPAKSGVELPESSGDVSENPQNGEHLVVCLVKEFVGSFHVVCHGSQPVSKARPELVLVGNPLNMDW